MKYISTRGSSPAVSFKEALFHGLASDGGLYIPETFPALSPKQIESLKTAPLDELGAVLLGLFITDIPHTRLQQIVKQGLSFPLPMKKVGSTSVLELFHGPTMAFKDVAAQILPLMMEYYLEKEKRRITILTATSGDTGGAVAHGFANKKNIQVVILFPHGNVSELQRKQLTQVAENIFPIEVKGTFDDCQSIIKKAFADSAFKRLNLTSANSINIGRLLPQMIYYAYVWQQLNTEHIQFIVPSGNMGNITAGLYAQKIGIPIQSFVAACNINDPVVQYYQHGIFKPQNSVKTLSTAMDIGNPSNFERILSLMQHNHKTFTKLVQAVTVTDEETVETIKQVYNRYKYLLDPHTAVAWSAYERLESEASQSVVISTASPDKFESEILRATGIRFTVKKNKYNNTERVFTTSCNYPEVSRYILGLLEE